MSLGELRERIIARGFGETMKALRRSSGLTLSAVGRHLDLSIGYLSDIERGRRKPLNAGKIFIVAGLFSSGHIGRFSKSATLYMLDKAAAITSQQYVFDLGNNWLRHLDLLMLLNRNATGLSEYQVRAIVAILQEGGQ